MVAVTGTVVAVAAVVLVAVEVVAVEGHVGGAKKVLQEAGGHI